MRKLKSLIEEVLEHNNSLCMDVPAERRLLCNKLIKALSTHNGAIASIRHGAEIFYKGRNAQALTVIPNQIVITGDKIIYHTGSNHVSVFSVGNLIYYFADMLE